MKRILHILRIITSIQYAKLVLKPRFNMQQYTNFSIIFPEINLIIILYPATIYSDLKLLNVRVHH